MSSLRKYFLKQKMSGVVMIVLGILLPLLFNGDATGSLFLLPLGIFLLVTKDKVMDFRL